MTKMGQDHWMDKVFRKKLEGFEIKPSDTVWENISKHLDGERKRPQVVGYWKPIYWAILAGVILMGLAIWYFGNKDQAKQEPMEMPFHEQSLDPVHAKDLSSIDIKAKENKTPIEISQTKTFDAISLKKNKNQKQPLQLSLKSKLGKSEKKEKQGDHLISDLPSNEVFELASATILTQSSTQDISIGEEAIQTNLLASTDVLFQGGPNSFYAPNSMTNAIENKVSDVLLEETKQEKVQVNSAAAEGCNVYKNNTSHFYIDGYYAPELASRSFSADKISDLAYAEKRSATEKAIMSYTIGLRASVVFPSGIAVRSGLQFSNNTERFDYIKETQIITIERKDKDGNVIGFETIEKEIMDQSYNHYKYVDIPIIIGYEKELKDFILSLNTGLGINISSSQSGKIYQSDLKSIYNVGNQGEGNTVLYKNHAGISWIGSIGLNYKYNDKIMLMLEPSARYYLKSITDEAYPLRQKYLFMGLNIGLRYKIQ